MATQVDTKPWSSYKQSDYSLEQWHAACLIHHHQGAPTAMVQCKLPVKTPDGVLNKNGVQAAAAALAGSRGGVIASSSDKGAAAKTLLRYYSQLNMKPPDSLTSLAHSFEGALSVNDILEHHGVKGMKWGVRKDGSQGSGFRLTRKGRLKSAPAPSEDKARVNEALSKVKSGNTSALSNKELQAVVTRMNLEQQFSRLTSRPSTKGKGAKFVSEVLGNVAKQQATKMINDRVNKAIGSRLSK